jgi:inorganic pyrophosphatase
MQEPVHPLSLLRARPIGMMHMVDEGESDEKIICVHLDDPEYSSYEHHSELPEHRLTELQRFFQDYKVLEGKEVDVGNFSDPQEAKDAVRHAIHLYDQHFAQTGQMSETKVK